MADATYIGRSGQQLGPYSAAQLAAMAAAGQILQGDLAWHQGMQGWEPANAVLSRLGLGGTASAPPLPAAALIIPSRTAPGAAAVADGAADRNLAAGLGKRWLASIIDSLILVCAYIAILVAFGFASAASGSRSVDALILLTLLAPLLYFTLTQGGAPMASVGKRAMDMIVVGSDGQPLGYLRAAVRYVLLVISSYLFPLLLVAFFTRRRQAVHDLAVGSVVLERASYDPQHWDYERIGKSPRGGGALFVIGVVVLVFFIGMLAAIAIPAYHDYTLRSRVQQAITLADPIKSGVTRHYSSSNAPLQYTDIGMSGPLAMPGDGGLITVNESGVITIMLGMPPLSGQSVRLTPVLSSTGISWSCASDDVKKKYLPLSCR